MAKFYQHMEPGDTLGKITKLKYIDDVSDDEFTLYTFEDGTVCDEAFVAEVNSMNAFNGRYMMAELTDPLNVWKFEKKEFNLDSETKIVRGADGNEYELPASGISVNGEHISVGLSEDGTSRAQVIESAGKRTISTPPKVIKNKTIEPKENYLLSLHPELLNGSAKTETPVIVPNSKSNTTVGQTQPVVPIKQVILQPALTVPQAKVSQSSPISTNVIETVRHASITINLDDIKNSTEYDSVNVIIDGEQQTLSVSEFINRLTNKVPEPVVIKEEQPEISPLSDPNFKEDILITNMIDKSKKILYTIGVDIDIELPPYSVYKTIKDVYPDGMAQHFVTCISRRMDGEVLKQALSTGLTGFYESSVSDPSAND